MNSESQSVDSAVRLPSCAARPPIDIPGRRRRQLEDTGLATLRSLVSHHVARPRQHANRFVHHRSAATNRARDLGGAHALRSQPSDLLVVKFRGPSPIDPLRLRGRDTRRLPVPNKTDLHLSHHAQHCEDDLAHGSRRIDGWIEHTKMTPLDLQTVDKVKNVAGASAETIKPYHHKSVARLNEVENDREFRATFPTAARNLLLADDIAARGFQCRHLTVVVLIGRRYTSISDDTCHPFLQYVYFASRPSKAVCQITQRVSKVYSERGFRVRRSRVYPKLTAGMSPKASPQLPPRPGPDDRLPDFVMDNPRSEARAFAHASLVAGEVAAEHLTSGHVSELAHWLLRRVPRSDRVPSRPVRRAHAGTVGAE